MMKKILMTALMLMGVSTVASGNTFMDAAWAKQACNAWNADPVLTSQLMNTEVEEDETGYSWMNNNANRGYKLVQMYRTQCGPASKVQLIIQEKNGKAMCIAGGKPDGKAMNYKVDYLMHASDKNWACMGKGSFGCGAMGAMATGKLKFTGPKLEAMKVMAPFENFLRLTGKVAGDKAACPK